MLDLFGAPRERACARGGVAVLVFWRFALTDLLHNSLAERTRRWRRHPLTDRPQLPPESLRDPRESMQTALREIRHAARRLVKAPVFSLMAVMIVALGIGANTAIFSFVDGVVLRPQPYERPEEIVDVYQDSGEGEPNSNSYPAYCDIKASTSVFSDAVGVMSFGVTLLEEDGATSLATEWVTSNYFSMLGLRPFLGRDFEPADQIDGGEPVAILGYATWQGRFGTDPDILGRRLNLNSTQVTIVGIAPREYGGVAPGFAAEIWMSLAGMRPIFGDYVGNTIDNRGDHWFLVKARLADGVSPEQAQSAMTSLADRLATEFPEFKRGRRITVFAPGEVRLHPSFDAQLLPMSVGLMGIVGLVLLIACSNLANLLLLRGAARSKDITLRLALGASRGQVFAHVLSESILLSLTGGAVGLLLARWAINAFRAAELPLGLPAPIDLRLDPRMMAFTFALALGTGIVFGLLPAWRLSRADLVSSIRENVSPLSFRTGRITRRNALVVGQVTLSFVLLVVAGLFVHSLGAAQQEDLGFEPGGLAAISADLGHVGFERDEWVLWLDWPGENRAGSSSLSGSFRNGRGEFFSTSSTVGTETISRYTFSDISAGSLRWDDAFSSDGGDTWTNGWIMEFSGTSDHVALPAEGGPAHTFVDGSRCTLPQFHALSGLAGRREGIGGDRTSVMTGYNMLDCCAVIAMTAPPDAGPGYQGVLHMTYNTYTSRFELTTIDGGGASSAQVFYSLPDSDEIILYPQDQDTPDRRVRFEIADNGEVLVVWETPDGDGWVEAFTSRFQPPS